MTDTNNKKTSGFGLGLALGAVLGGVAAFFLSPKSGPENREMVAKRLKMLQVKLKNAKIPEKLGTFSKEATKFYDKVSLELSKDLGVLQDNLENTDWDKYKETVESVMARVRKEINVPTDEVEKLKSYLLKQWDSILGDAKTETKKVVKSVKKSVKKASKK